MTSTKSIVGIAPLLMGASLLGHTAKTLKKGKKVGSVIKSGVGIIVGSSLIKSTSNIIGGL